MKIFLSYRERLAGLFLVGMAMLVVAFFVGAAVHNKWLVDRVRYHATVERGDGLRSGSPILWSGVEVGEVGALKILDSGAVDVELVVLAEHSKRIQPGCQAVVRRLLGIGEKRVHLSAPQVAGKPLAEGSRLPVREPMDILDVVGDLDFGTYLKTLNRALTTVEKLMTKLDENNRFDRLVAAFDRIGPLVEKADTLLGNIGQPVEALVKNPALAGALQGLSDLTADPDLHATLQAARRLLADPNLRRALAGADAILSDPATRKLVHGGAELLDPARLNKLLEHSEHLVAQLDMLMGEKGPATSVLRTADKLLSDGKVERLLGAVERLADEKKLAKILDNVAVLAEQTGKIGPEIPKLTKELTITLREAVVVLKALQKVWVLEGKANDARKEVEKGAGEDGGGKD